MGWWSARDLVPPRAVTPAAARRPPGARAFLVLSIADFVALTCDNLVVGQSTDASRLGLYSLAFTLAFAPLTQFSWQIGTVLFPAAAATDDLATVARRTLRAARMTALILVPLVVPSLLLAPVVIPAVLGDDWRLMVAPFQLLLVTGVGHGIVNVIGESLSGKGGIRFRAWLHAGWALATVVTVAVLVNADGIRGAALAHLILFVPLAGAYATRGIRMLGSSPAALWRVLRRVAAAVAIEAAAGAAVWWLLDAADASTAIARTAAAIVALVVAAAMLGVGEHSPVRDAARSFRTRSA
jgi:O-antigen/teichoic acid export membrane protein